MLKTRDLFAPKIALSGDQSTLFSGRESFVSKALQSIDIPGATTVVYGDRGVGKSSFGWQLFEILDENRDVIGRYPKLEPIEDQYVCFWIECEERFGDIGGLLFALLRESEGKKGRTIRDRYPKLFEPATSDRIDRSYEFNVAMAKAKFEVKPDSKAKNEFQKAIDDLDRRSLADPFDLFGKLVSLVRAKEVGKEIVVFVDEFDRLPDKSRMGDFVKHFGGARSVLIGVSETAEQLVGQHPSSERKLLGSQIQLPPLSVSEIGGIFTNASSKVQEHRKYKSISFDSEFLDAVFGACGGYPAIAQFLGFEAFRKSKILRRALSTAIVVGMDDFKIARDAVLGDHEVTSGLDETEAHYGPDLRKAIGKSARKAAILSELAKHQAGWLEKSRLRARLIESHQQGFERNINELLNTPVIIGNNPEGTSTAIKFATPVYRFMVRMAIDNGTLFQS